MNEFDFILSQGLRAEHFDDKNTEYLLKNLIVKERLTIFVAPSNTGKSWLALAVAKMALDAGLRMVACIDMENHKKDLEARGILRLVQNWEFGYIHRTSIETTPINFLENAQKRAFNNFYIDTIFIIDGIKHLARDIKNDREIKEMMEKVVKLRDAGATVIMLHHTNKRGDQKGSSEITDLADNIISVEKNRANEERSGKLILDFEPVKTRNALDNTTLAIDLGSLEISQYETQEAQEKFVDEAFVSSVLTALKSEPMTQSKLLETLGFTKGDTRVREMLYEYEGRFWNIEKGLHNSIVFHKIDV
ncbi:hypothetical protein FACS189487_05730 [Campylobacterota bacterium]|nr:hypothetical protein FACS189487_05730 [Campylobacterota bacterium]